MRSIAFALDVAHRAIGAHDRDARSITAMRASRLAAGSALANQCRGSASAGPPTTFCKAWRSLRPRCRRASPWSGCRANALLLRVRVPSRGTLSRAPEGDRRPARPSGHDRRVRLRIDELREHPRNARARSARGRSRAARRDRRGSRACALRRASRVGIRSPAAIAGADRSARWARARAVRSCRRSRGGSKRLPSSKGDQRPSVLS